MQPARSLLLLSMLAVITIFCVEAPRTADPSCASETATRNECREVRGRPQFGLQEALLSYNLRHMRLLVRCAASLNIRHQDTGVLGQLLNSYMGAAGGLVELMLALQHLVASGQFSNGLDALQQSFGTAPHRIFVDAREEWDDLLAKLCYEEMPLCRRASAAMTPHEGVSVVSYVDAVAFIEQDLLLPVFTDLLNGLETVVQPEKRRHLAEHWLWDADEAARTLHVCARLGFARALRAYASAVATLTSSHFALGVLRALSAVVRKDGQSIFHQILNAYGPGSREHSALSFAAQVLTDASGLDWVDEATFLATLSQPLPHKELAQAAGPVGSSNGGSSQTRTHHFDLEHISSGWATTHNDIRWEAVPAARCDALVIDAPLTMATIALTNTISRPVLLRSAAVDLPVTRQLSRDTMLTQWGTRNVSVAPIPYSGRYPGMAPAVQMPLAAFVDTFEGGPGGPMELFAGWPPPYLFASALLDQQGALESLGVLPPAVLSALGGASRVSPQLYLGPAASGAPLHYHGPSINVLAHGRKRWFLLPPNQTAMSILPAVEWYVSDFASQPGVLECVQHSGDVLLLPARWSHATLNLETCVGVAVEHGVE